MHVHTRMQETLRTCTQMAVCLEWQRIMPTTLRETRQDLASKPEEHSVALWLFIIDPQELEARIKHQVITHVLSYISAFLKRVDHGRLFNLHSQPPGCWFACLLAQNVLAIVEADRA